MQKFNPGEIAPKSGCYCVFNTQGKQVSSIEIEQGKTLPPTDYDGYYYQFDCECK